MPLMELDDDEVKSVLMERQRKERQLQLKEKQAACQHWYRFVAGGRGDKMYECTRCGHVEWM